MANENKQNILIHFFPDWPVFKRLASRVRIKKAYKTAMPESDVLSGEKGGEEKHRVVEKCKKKWTSAADGINIKIDELFQTIPFFREGTDDLELIREDMLFKYFAYGFQPNEYFAFRLDNKSPEQTEKYISERLRMKFRCQMNNLLQAHFFNDKYETYTLFKDRYKREAIAVEKQRDYDKFRDFVTRHPVFVKKQVYLAQGHSVESVDTRKGRNTDRELFESIISSGKHIIEEIIEQTPDMAAFNDSSVNTVRVITFNTRHGFKVPYCMIRTGRPGAFVDNSGAGGIQAEIDFDSGIVISDGFDELGGNYTEHPASGRVFRGFKLPDWDQLKALVFSSAAKVPDIKFIGWDLAHTAEGWVIVEGNENCYVIALQQIRGTGMRPVFEELMADMDLNSYV